MKWRESTAMWGCGGVGGIRGWLVALVAEPMVLQNCLYRSYWGIQLASRLLSTRVATGPRSDRRARSCVPQSRSSLRRAPVRVERVAAGVHEGDARTGSPATRTARSDRLGAATDLSRSRHTTVASGTTVRVAAAPRRTRSIRGGSRRHENAAVPRRFPLPLRVSTRGSTRASSGAAGTGLVLVGRPPVLNKICLPAFLPPPLAISQNRVSR
jgi:hypothetical protein